MKSIEEIINDICRVYRLLWNRENAAEKAGKILNCICVLQDSLGVLCNLQVNNTQSAIIVLLS